MTVRTPESRPGRWRGVRRAIVKRNRERRFVVRLLACGHQQVEPDGGRAKDAQFALCRPCALTRTLCGDGFHVVTTLDPED